MDIRLPPGLNDLPAVPAHGGIVSWRRTTVIVLSLSWRCRKKKNADEDVDEDLKRLRRLPDPVVLLAARSLVEDATGRAGAATVA